MASLTLEEHELRADSKYRQYTATVDKALKSFEYTSEWADLISALGKLNKVLVSNIKYPVIPSRIVISKRLAQCMHPALPSGVHLKALECYDIMFKCMGTNRLSQELFIYSAGLFPLFGHAAMNVRPALLTIYETHFVPLGRRLRPGLRGFLSGILPGLDEGSDYFDRTATLIQRIAEGVETDYFFGCLWDCVLCNPAIRLPAITFTLMKFNKKVSMEDQLFIMGTDLDVTVGALCAAVQDSSVLVQRFTLDLLLAAFPMHNSQLMRSDLVRLVTAAVTVLLRRDMSLNRRLYSWLLGSEVDVSVLPSENPVVKRTESVTSNTSCDQSTAYFDAYSRPLTIDAITNCLSASSVSTSPDVRPYRLIISLLDKPEIGPPILDYIMIEVLRALYQNYQSAGGGAATSPSDRRPSRQNSTGATDGTKQQQDLVKTANLLFGALEPHYVWEYMKVKYGEACRRVVSACDPSGPAADPEPHAAVQPVGGGDPDVAECCALIVFLLDVISTETSVEVQTEHLPDLVCGVLQSLGVTLTEGVGRLRPADLCCSLDICRTVLNKAQPGTRRSRSPPAAPPAPPPGSVRDASRLFAALFASLVEARLLAHGVHVADSCRRLALGGRSRAEERDAGLRQLLLQRVEASGGPGRPAPQPPPAASRQEQVEAALRVAEAHHVPLSPEAGQYAEAFRSACQLLVVLSSFPATEDREESPPPSAVPGALDLPPWLSALLTVACFAPLTAGGPTGLPFSAVSTLLDLVALVTSVGAAGSQRAAVQPLLTPDQHRAIVDDTVVTQLLTRRLWRLLSPERAALHLPCVDLLQLMLSLMPPQLVENQLAADMTHPDLAVRTEAFSRFAVLWHLSREVSARRHISRSFDRCLLLMLDCLRDPSGPLHAVARTWLTHTLQRGDVTRIMEPLLLLLLTPSTARVSVQHINVRATESDAKESDELGRVYAISSVEGNVIYHVSEEAGAPAAAARRASAARKLMTLTSVAGPGGAPQTRAGTVRLPGPHQLSSALLQPISVFVNPITVGAVDADESDADPPVSLGARRLDLSGVRRFSPDQPAAGRTATDGAERAGSQTPFDGLSRLFDGAEESVSLATSIVNEIVDLALDKCNLKESKWVDKKEPEQSQEKLIHPLHSFMLLYCQVCDSGRILYALQTLRAVLETDCRLTLCSMATTSVCSTSGQSPGNRSQQIQVLLACHRQSMQGRRFGGEQQAEALTAYRSAMLLEVVLSQCVQFIRSYYPTLEPASVTAEQLRANRQVQIVSAEILTSMFSELVTVVRSSGRGFATYLADVLQRCRVQKTLLNCLLSTVHSLRAGPRTDTTLTEDIIEFNEVCPPGPAGGGGGVAGSAHTPLLSFTETLQIQLIRLVLSLLILEDQTDQLKSDMDGAPSAGGRVGTPSASEAAKFYPGHPVPAQPMLLNAITGALKQSHRRHLHHHWLSLVTSSLPFIRRPLPHIVTSVVTQLVHNIEQLAAMYRSESRLAEDACVPPDHMVYLVESLTVICHFCMIDSSQQGSGVQSSSSAELLQTYAPGSSAPQVLSNLLHVLTTAAPLKDDGGRDASTESLLNARRLLLNSLPRIVVGLAALWQAITARTASESPSWILGVPRMVKQQVLELLSPISHHHPANFVAAVAAAWHERRLRGQPKQSIPEFCADQLVLVDLVSSIRVIPIDNLVQTVRSVVKQPPNIGLNRSQLPCAALQFLLCHLRSVPAPALAECWSSLLVLLRDAGQLTPPAQFLLLAVLNEYVQRAPPLPERKDQRDLQDVAAKLVEACSAVAGACLEQTTWLRRNLAVRAVPGGSSERDQTASPEPGKPTSNGHSPEAAQWSVQALRILAELLAPLLDVLYQSDEKDRVLPLLTGVMCHVTPYLKEHSPANTASFLACSQLLASLSEYQYSRRAWRREAFDLLLEPAFFSMQEQCLPFWRTTIDNLMTHDKTTFKELLARVVVSQPGTLNLFSSREAEYELRAQLLKRLAFVVFCSDEDQYQPHLPEIQEKLAESLRLPQVAPSIQSAVLLCFRVLLLRMSSRHVVSLWPSIITELVQVLLQMEHQLSMQSDEFSQQLKKLSALDGSWSGSSNGLSATGHPGALQLHLEACKLLDLCLTLPAHRLPQFQMYRWAFVGSGDQESSPAAVPDTSAGGQQLQPRDFVPHVTRLTQLVLQLCRGSPPEPLRAAPHQPLLHVTSVRQPADLYPFFVALGGGRPRSSDPRPATPADRGPRPSAEQETVAAVEAVLARDFLEPLGEQR
ncbi:protein dopey-1-like [Amphibalanus amphitrite]|uniref:protein dopey-1-like n=1 Tax=Amphibalanus amphitrite TaxID=1232801 RepID=UPI001C8FED1C|nr:protein dopey-1-like [Amphibalanus amphitrite]